MLKHPTHLENLKQVIKANGKGKRGHGEATSHPNIGHHSTFHSGDINFQYEGRKDSVYEADIKYETKRDGLREAFNNG